jgi:hypothetical protein
MAGRTRSQLGASIILKEESSPLEVTEPARCGISLMVNASQI